MEARDLLSQIGYPSEADYKKIVVHGVVDDGDITMKQIKDAHDTFGQDIYDIKGKWVRRKPERVNQNYVAVPKSIAQRHKKVTLSIDIMFIQNTPMLVTVSHHIKFTTIATMDNRNPKNILRELKIVFAIYATRGF